MTDIACITSNDKIILLHVIMMSKGATIWLPGGGGFEKNILALIFVKKNILASTQTKKNSLTLGMRKKIVWL